jgi:hypothetical protein
MNLLLPQTRGGILHRAQPVDIHGDRYVDVEVALDGDDAPNAPATRTGRVSATECAPGLAAGDRVKIRFVMGVMTRIERDA